MKPKRRGGRPCVRSFSVPPEKMHVLDWIDEEARRERESKSHVIIRCIEHYFKEKWPGNPQPPLFPSIKPQFVTDEAARARKARLRKAVTFLRFKARLSYDQIALVVGKSRKFVRNICKGMDPELYPVNMDNRRLPRKRERAEAFKKNLQKYRVRLQKWLAGKYGTVEEAFTFER